MEALEIGLISEHEDDVAEADAAVPQHGGQWHVADRTDERQHRDDSFDDRAPDGGGDDRMFRQTDLAVESVAAEHGIRRGWSSANRRPLASR